MVGEASACRRSSLQYACRGGGGAFPQTPLVDRPIDEVVIKASQLPLFSGFDINRLALFRWSGTNFEPIPFQVDEVADVVQLVPPVAHCAEDTFPIPPNAAVCERNYAFLDDGTVGGGDPGFDDFDELVFLARDTGPQAGDLSYPTTGTWYNWRYDIKIQDEKLLQPGGNVIVLGASWAYLFYSSVPLEAPPYGDRHYVEWNTDPDTGDPVPPQGSLPAENCRTTDPVPTRGKLACGWARPFVDQSNGLWSLPGIETHWIGNWTLNRARFRPSGSSTASSDLIDRIKWRLGNRDGMIFYSEHLWDTTCARMVGLKHYDATKRTPIRVLRKIQGNRSGSTTTRNDWYFGTHLRTRVRLRVHHGLPNLRVFADYLREPLGKELFTKTHPTTRADVIDGLGAEHTPITSYAPGMWIRWDTSVAGSQRVYSFLKETKSLKFPSAIADYSDDGTADTEAVGELQKEAGRYGNHGVMWVGPSLDMQDWACDTLEPDNPEFRWAEVELFLVAAPPTKSAADVEDWLTRPLAVLPTAQSLPYVPPSPPDPPCTPAAAASIADAGVYAEIGSSVTGPCAPSTTGVSIYRAVGAGAFHLLTRIVPGLTFRDPNVVPGVTYKYKLYGTNRTGQSSTASNTIALQVQDIEAPSAPTNPSATALSLGAHLAWTSSTSWDTVGHDVYVSTTPGGPYLKLTSQPVPIPTTEYTIGGLDPYVIYYAVVRSVDRVGNLSSNSEEVSFVALP